jgi:eukaryotic-like serine/threonine-protein kinase
MEGMLRPGDRLALASSGLQCTVDALLGVGGQGEVYRVKLDGSSRPGHALKWYHAASSTDGQRAILDQLLRMPAPDSRFLWPVDVVTWPGRSGFGYVMPLRPPNFHGLVKLLQNTVRPSFRALATAGFELADGFLQLHGMGYCYRDINFGNVFFDPDTGAVLIGDNDNVGVDGETVAGVSGTPGFIAPEILRGESAPSIQTDLFSLSVLLFYMLMVHHPLLGRRELDEPSLDSAALFRLYAESPTFIFDPTDRSNEPVAGYHDNALVFWRLYPNFLQRLFLTAFTEGLRDPLHGRVRETEWRIAMVRLRDAIIGCPRCGAQCFYDDALGAVPDCWGCGEGVVARYRMQVVDGVAAGALVVLDKDTVLYPHHLGERRYDFSREVAGVVRHPADPSLWGLQNRSASTWTATVPAMPPREVPPGRSIALAPNTRLDFGTARATISCD